MSDLPDNGDVIEFGSVTEGSPARVGVRYRVEKKPLELEYLLIDIVSGHAFRFQPQQFSGSGWKLAPAAKEVEAKGAASADSQPTEGLLVAKPLSDLPFVEDSDEEEVDEEEEDPVTKTKTIVKKKKKKSR